MKVADPRFVDCEQNSPEWLAARLGCVTASHIADVMARLKRGGEMTEHNISPKNAIVIAKAQYIIRNRA